VEICNRLNSIPRKCLGYKTLAEVFRQKVSPRSGARDSFGIAQVAVRHELTDSLGASYQSGTGDEPMSSDHQALVLTAPIERIVD
jgi:hypothetical protein